METTSLRLLVVSLFFAFFSPFSYLLANSTSSSAKSEPDKFKTSIKNTINAWDFLLEQAIKGLDLSKGDDKAKASRYTTPILSLIDDKIVQSHYISLVARKLSVPEASVEAQLTGIPEEKPQVIDEAERYSRRELLERMLLAISMSNLPEFLKEQKVTELIRTPFASRLLEVFKKTKNFNIKSFARSLPEELKEGFHLMILKEPEERTKDKAKKDLLEVVANLEALDLKAQLTNITAKITELEQKDSPKALQLEQEKFSAISKKLAELQSRLDNGSNMP